MAGPSVVIVDAGGLPVTPVQSGAPVLTVTDDKGFPVTISPNAAPFILQGNQPTPPPTPEPGPLDFSTNEVGLTVYETEFDVAEPNVMMGLVFAYTGTPTFSITHEGEPLSVEVQLSSYGDFGCLIADGRNLTVEGGNLKIEVSGGSIGPFFGRVNETGFEPGAVTYQKFNTYLFSEEGSFANTGKVFLVAATGWGTLYPTVDSPMDMKAFRKNFASNTVYTVGPPVPLGLGWEYDASENRWSHTIAMTTQSGEGDIDVFPPISEHALGWKVYDVQTDMADPQLSTYFFNSTGNVSQNIKAYPTGDDDGSWVAYTIYGYDIDQSYARAVGNTSFVDPEIHQDPLINCGAIASSLTSDVNSWNYSNNGYYPTAMIVALVEEAP